MDSTDDWESRVAARHAHPDTIELTATLADAAARCDTNTAYDTATARRDLEGHPVRARAAEALGAGRARRLGDPGGAIADAGYRVTYTVLHGGTRPAAGADVDEVEDLVDELDWTGLDPPPLAEIGDDLVTAALAGLGEDPDGDAADALHLAWGQGVAFAFAETPGRPHRARRSLTGPVWPPGPPRPRCTRVEEPPSERSTPVPPAGPRRRLALRDRIAEADASDLPHATLDEPIELYRCGGSTSLIHAAPSWCTSTSRRHNALPYRTTIRDAAEDPNLCDCAAHPAALGAPGAYLGAFRYLHELAGIADRLEAEPEPHRWVLWVQLTSGTGTLTREATRWDLDELSDALGALTARRDRLDAEVVTAWRRNRRSPAAALWWRANFDWGWCPPELRSVHRAFVAGHTPTELAAEGRFENIDVHAVWDELLEDCAELAAADPVTVVVEYSTNGPTRDVTLAQWGLANTRYEAVLQCPGWLPGRLPCRVLATTKEPVDDTAAQLILELAAPTFDRAAINAAIATSVAATAA